MRAEHNAQKSGRCQNALLLQRGLQVTLDQRHDQANAHYLHHDGHEAEPADEQQLQMEASVARQCDRLLEAVFAFGQRLAFAHDSACNKEAQHINHTSITRQSPCQSLEQRRS